MIYCVEDDKDIRELVMYALETNGFETKGFSDSELFWKEINNEKPQLIILDVMLPGENGIEILKKLRAQKATQDIPVMLATAKGTEYDKVVGLDSGADMYLVKPFGMLELISNVKALLRRTVKDINPEKLKVGKLEMNIPEHTVTSDGNKIELTFKEYEVLKFFMENLGKTYSREQLIERLWKIDFMGESRTVDVHIGTLRTKLGECGKYIHTVRGVGYKMEEYI